jgi:type IV secretory pathway VirB10-like protein
MEQTILKKKIIFTVMGFVCLSFVGGGVYLVNGYANKKPDPKVAKTNTELPSGTNVSVTVNNIVEHSAKPAQVIIASSPISSSAPIASGPVILPKISQKPNPQPVQQLMQQPPIVSTAADVQQKPNMLVISANDSNSSNSTNSISGTNTSVGTGEIDSKLKTQRSPYTIFAGTFIPASMVTGLNSELNGQIVATVRNDVYDTTAGKYLLIPQGSRLIGTYNHDISYGTNRLMAGWNRVIYPNGTSFLLHGQPGTDLQGFSGLTGDVDNHWLERFGSSALIGLIFGGMTAATGNQGTNPYQLSAGATIASQVGAQMSQTGLQVIQKGMNIPPTVIISPGYKFNILTTADLVLKPYIYKR